MEHVEVFLNRLGLGQYAPAFEANGYDTLDIIFIMDDDDFERFGPFIGMLPGHLYRLKKAVHGMKNQSTCDSNVSVVPIVQLTAADTVANVTAAAAADTTTSTHAVVTPAFFPTKRKAPSYDLPEFCDTSKEVRLQSLKHSTQLGSSSMRDNKSSGRRKIVYRCKSVLSKRTKKSMGPNVEGTEYKCNHCLVWNYTKKRDGFKLHRAQSVLEHHPHCVATQKVSRTELVHDTGFVKHSLNEANSTGKQAAKSALGRGGRLDGSINSRTAKRASNDVKRFHDKDYDEDWSKLRPWGAEYERLNNNPAQSRFDMKTDEQNRSVTKRAHGPWGGGQGLWDPGPKGPGAHLTIWALGPKTSFILPLGPHLVRSQV